MVVRHLTTMKKILTIAALTSAVTAGAQTTELGITGGYAGGLGGEVFLHRSNVYGPIGVKLSAAYSNADGFRDNAPYSTALPLLGTFGDAKKTLGVTESGSQFVLGLDGTYSLGEVAPGVRVLGYAGPRYGMFTATESVPGGSTTYKMNSFGLGAGVQASYALAGNISLVGDLGADYFMNGGVNYTNSANGTVAQTGTYGTGDAGYAEQRNRLAFPGTNFKAKVGVKFTF